MHHRGNFKDHEGPALGSVYSRWLLGNAGVSTTHSWIQDMKLKAEWWAGSVTMVMGRPSYFITPCCPLFVTVQTFARPDCIKPFHQSLAWQKARSPAHLGGHEQCFQECGMSLQRTEEDNYVLNIDWAQFMILSVSFWFGKACTKPGAEVCYHPSRSCTLSPRVSLCSGQAEAGPAYCPAFPQKYSLSGCRWWHIPIILTLRQEDSKFKVSLDCRVRPCLKTKLNCF